MDSNAETALRNSRTSLSRCLNFGSTTSFTALTFSDNDASNSLISATSLLLLLSLHCARPVPIAPCPLRLACRVKSPRRFRAFLFRGLHTTPIVRIDLESRHRNSIHTVSTGLLHTQKAQALHICSTFCSHHEHRTAQVSTRRRRHENRASRSSYARPIRRILCNSVAISRPQYMPLHAILCDPFITSFHDPVLPNPPDPRSVFPAIPSNA